MQDEPSLIEQARRGDGGAFDQLMEPLLPRAYRTACLITHDPASGADALQEALIRAYRSLANLRPGAPLSPWFTRIVVNEALKQCQGGQKRVTLPLPEALPDSRTPESTLMAREEQERIWQAVQALPPHHRAVVVLRYYEELSEAEMAAVLSVSPGTVKSRLFHARASLERRLRAERAPSLLLRLGRILHGGDQA